MRFAKGIFLLLSLITLQNAGIAEPQIRQFFPARTVLLGQPFFWTIKIHYPLWESYTLQVQPCGGARIEIADQRIAEEEGEIASTYRLKIVPEDLKVTGTPSVLITGRNGQSIVLNGKPIVVGNISGSSLEIRNASAPHFKQIRITGNSATFYLTIFLGAAGLTMLFWLRRRARTPRQVLLREFGRSQLEIQKEHLPFALWRHLRSELLWGFSAEACTAHQLKEAAGSNARLVLVAEALQIMEQMRYSGEKSFRPDPVIWKAVTAAVELAQKGGKR